MELFAGRNVGDELKNVWLALSRSRILILLIYTVHYNFKFSSRVTNIVQHNLQYTSAEILIVF